MGNYDDIGLPVKGQPISSGAFGIKVRNYLINADARLSAIEGSLLPRYYVKANVTSRNTTTTVAADTGTGHARSRQSRHRDALGLQRYRSQPGAQLPRSG